MGIWSVLRTRGDSLTQEEGRKGVPLCASVSHWQNGSNDRT